MTTRQAFLILCWYQRDYYMPYQEDIEIIRDVLLPLLKDDHSKISKDENSMTYHEVYENFMTDGLPKLQAELEGETSRY